MEIAIGVPSNGLSRASRESFGSPFFPTNARGNYPPFPSVPIAICCSSDRAPQPLAQTSASRSKAKIVACEEENHLDGIEETLSVSTRDVKWKGPEMKKSMLPSITFLAAALAVGS